MSAMQDAWASGAVLGAVALIAVFIEVVAWGRGK